MKIKRRNFGCMVAKHGLTVLAVGFAVTLLSSCGDKEAKIIPKSTAEVKTVKQEPVVNLVEPKPVVKLVENLETIDGSKIYKKCQACHVKTGEGVPGAYPPLTDRLHSLLENDAGREYLALVSMNGVGGEINIDGTRYIGIMPRQGGMTPGKTAAVLNYIMTEFNGVELDDVRLFAIDEIEKVSSENGRMSSQNVYKKRAEAFGEE